MEKSMEFVREPDPEPKPKDIKLVHLTSDLEADPVLGPSDPRPIERIVRDIVCLFRDHKGYNQARDRRFAVEILACFQARIAMAQHPKRFGRDMRDDDYKQLLDLCVQHLVHCDCPAQETVQLQVTVQTALERSTANYVKTRIKYKETLDSIMGFIVDVKAGDIRKLFEIVELLHGLMMEYLVELSRQIDTDEVVADLRNGEILEALESVLPKKVLLYWMDLPQEEKILQMEELADVVIGIRVFNKCMQRGGEQFILPYTKYEVESDNLRKRVQDTIKLVDSRVANCILGIRAHVGEFGLGHMFIVRLRDELTYFMQAAVYLNSLDIFIVERLNEVINVREYSAHCVNRIVGTIGNRKNIPAELVYPELRRIGMYQRNILQEYNLLRAHSVAADPLFALSEKPEFVMAPMGSRRLEIKAKNFLFLPRGSSLECPSDSILEIGGCQRATLVDDGQVESLKSRLEYGGFCPVSLVVKNGMLMRGDTKIGLVQTGDKFYAFTDEEAMGRFLKAPQAYLRSIHAFLLKMPQLIHILGLHNTQAFSYVSIPKILQLFKEPLPSDFGVQTCAHALPIHRWDEETLEKRVQALKKMRTDSTQTKESHFHRHNLCQVYPMKEKWTQTGVSRGTTMAHHVRVLHNLRGDLHENVKVVKATFEMEDTVDLYQLNRGMNADESEESRLRICEGRAGEEGPSSGDL